jgi:hypothetical protein
MSLPLPYLIESYKRTILTTVLLLLFSFKTFAQGDIIIMPKRVVFDNSKRTALLNISNIGVDTATYTISFKNLKMLDNGSFEAITQPETEQNFADNYIRVYPKKITLAPNEVQTIKLQVYKFNELNSGEYRSHLYLRSTSRHTSSGQSAKKDSATIAMKLTPIYGISIPAIIRAGKPSVKTDISDISLNILSKDSPEVQFTLNRSGNVSVYGDVTVDYVSNKGQSTRIGGLVGVAVYTPNKFRRIHLKLDNKEGVDLTSGKLLITFDAQDTNNSQANTKVEVSLN